MIRNVQGSFGGNLETDEKLPKIAQHHEKQVWIWAECRSSELSTCGTHLLAIAAVGLFAVAKTDMIGLTCLHTHHKKIMLPHYFFVLPTILMFVVATRAFSHTATNKTTKNHVRLVIKSILPHQ